MQTMHFKKRADEVEAVQFSFDGSNGPDIVEWILNNEVTAIFYDAKPAELGPDGSPVKARQSMVQIVTPSGVRVAMPGYYVVLDEAGVFDVYDQEYFERKYEIILIP